MDSSFTSIKESCIQVINNQSFSAESVEAAATTVACILTLYPFNTDYISLCSDFHMLCRMAKSNLSSEIYSVFQYICLSDERIDEVLKMAGQLIEKREIFVAEDILAEQEEDRFLKIKTIIEELIKDIRFSVMKEIVEKSLSSKILLNLLARNRH